MLNALRVRLTKDEKGFTLIELMVVVLIIAILIAIAIPTFLGAQDRARDRGAQSNLRNALTAAKTIATDDAGAFTNATAANMDVAEGSLAPFIATAPAATDDDDAIYIANDEDFVYLFTESASGTWFGIASNKSGQVAYCKGAGVESLTLVSVNATTGALAGCIGDSWSDASAEVGAATTTTAP